MFIKDFDSWNQLKKITDQAVPSTKIREGEIRWCKFGVNVGNEALGKGAGFKRPVLILKKFSSEVFLGVPLTSKIHQGSWYYVLEHEGIKRSVILNQARVLDRKRLEQKVYALAESELQKVKDAFIQLIQKS